MNVLALRWLGVPARDFEPMVGLFRDVMGLRVELEEPGTTELALPDGDRVQVFAPGHRHFELFARPVALFEVDDVRAARDEWVHFRAPDGNLYDLASRLPEAADSASSSSTASTAARSRAS